MRAKGKHPQCGTQNLEFDKDPKTNLNNPSQIYGWHELNKTCPCSHLRNMF